MAKQCSWRYLIYIESWGWSASLKYRLACASMLLQGGYLPSSMSSFPCFMHHTCL